MRALTIRDADRVAEAAVVLQRIAERIPHTAELLRGSFFGGDGAEVELQLAELREAQELASRIGCLQHELGDWEPGLVKAWWMRRHIWTGRIGEIPVMVWAFEVAEWAGAEAIA